jgi:hypothetical protein
MVLKAERVRSCASAIFITLLLCVALRAQDTQHQPPAPLAFDQQSASRLLLQLSESLQGHSQKQFFALFDLARMKDGPLNPSVYTSIWLIHLLTATRPTSPWMLRWRLNQGMADLSRAETSG